MGTPPLRPSLNKGGCVNVIFKCHFLYVGLEGAFLFGVSTMHFLYGGLKIAFIVWGSRKYISYEGKINFCIEGGEQHFGNFLVFNEQLGDFLTFGGSENPPSFSFYRKSA